MKPENRFIQSINKLLPFTHKEKMANPYRGGGADMWYSGNLGDLWIEYKWIPKLKKSVLPALTPLQKRWLRNRALEGRNVAVILGIGAGGIIYRDNSWNSPLSTEEATARLRSRQELAQWIFSEVGRGGHCSLAPPAPSKQLTVSSFPVSSSED